MKKKILIAVAAVVVVLLLTVVYASFSLLDYALNNSERQQSANYSGMKKEYPELRSWIDSLQRNAILRDTVVRMSNGENAHAILAHNDSAHGRTALLVHGYKDRAVRMLHIAYIYNKVLGYNILLPDLHAHGSSEGDDIQMGWKDRLEVLQWADIAEKAFRHEGDTSRMVLHGISMGAATVMNVSGEKTPEYIRCFVEDCGYTSAWDEFSHELKQQFGLPTFPLLYSASLLCKAKHGWSFGEAAPVKQVAKCNKPMFFIHGGNDTFVPTQMVYPCYEAKPQPKQLWIAPGSKHAQSYRDHKAEYTTRVRAFVERWMK